MHWCRVWHLTRRKMPIVPGMKRPWKVKVARTLVRSQLLYAKASWDFAFIYRPRPPGAFKRP